jgi:hypothetical protein
MKIAASVNHQALTKAVGFCKHLGYKRAPSRKIIYVVVLVCIYELGLTAAA